jgi:hypothetical protein
MNMKKYTHKTLLLIFSLIVCGLLQSCEDDPTKPAKRLLKKTSSIQYTGADGYSDGGSLGFFFSTEKDEELVIFIPVGSMSRPNVINGSQAVEITTEGNFHKDSPYAVIQNSKEETHLLKLLSKARDRESDPETKTCLNTLVQIVKTRNFRWQDYYEPAKGKSMIQPVEFSFNESLTKGSEQ